MDDVMFAPLMVDSPATEAPLDLTPGQAAADSLEDPLFDPILEGSDEAEGDAVQASLIDRPTSDRKEKSAGKST